MRVIISFFLSLIIYIAILAFLYFVLIPKKEKKEEVLIHTAIVNNYKPNIQTKKRTIKNTIKKPAVKKVEVKKPPKKVVKKGSKSAMTKGGNIDFNDIFKNVKANVPTKPLNFKKTLEMSRFKGLQRIEKDLNKIKTLNVDVTISSNNSNIKQEKINEIINKIGQIWYEISDIPGEYAKINVISQNGKVSAVILESNLDEAKQQELLKKIESLNFDKNFNLNILFQTKVNK
ncbi:hypothetical protein [Caminibacter pacificus]|uniref:Uncharacterized protein n=1 Tax=Caminibacter pacificus TaxID=1424653 RepID=A0AAJ4UXQ9_9BACT|nr:hypothetical protein [Caminibacter pacificus]QCI27902.1 hypothetical protein C6V80_02645 [Caminibacter pacificus]ROR39920.1 hypothetical protein EDC58_0899 [Caminibacter pacificus]